MRITGVRVGLSQTRVYGKRNWLLFLNRMYFELYEKSDTAGVAVSCLFN